jgi:hypothetical protein
MLLGASEVLHSVISCCRVLFHFSLQSKEGSHGVMGPSVPLLNCAYYLISLSPAESGFCILHVRQVTNVTTRGLTTLSVGRFGRSCTHFLCHPVFSGPNTRKTSGEECLQLLSHCTSFESYTETGQFPSMERSISLRRREFCYARS